MIEDETSLPAEWIRQNHMLKQSSLLLSDLEKNQLRSLPRLSGPAIKLGGLGGAATTGITTWRRSYAIICITLIRRNRDLFLSLIDHDKFVSNRGHRQFTTDPSGLRSPSSLGDGQFLFTDQHAYPVSARYFDDLNDLDQIDWDTIAARNFSRDPDDPGKIERYMAEALIYQHVPLSALKGMVCYSPTAEAKVLAMQAKAKVNLKLAIKPDWYF